VVFFFKSSSTCDEVEEEKREREYQLWEVKRGREERAAHFPLIPVFLGLFPLFFSFNYLVEVQAGDVGEVGHARDGL
jgi:hypothetical protein